MGELMAENEGEASVGNHRIHAGGNDVERALRQDHRTIG